MADRILLASLSGKNLTKILAYARKTESVCDSPEGICGGHISVLEPGKANSRDDLPHRPSLTGAPRSTD